MSPIKALSLLTLLPALAGCASSLLALQEPVHTQVQLCGTPEAAFTQAVSCLAGMGAQITTTSPTTRSASAVVHGVVDLTIVVDAHAGAEITGAVRPGKFVIGSLTEVQEYAARLTQETTCAH